MFEFFEQLTIKYEVHYIIAEVFEGYVTIALNVFYILGFTGKVHSFENEKRPPLDFHQMVVWNGGGERWRKKVDNLGDFLKNLPRKEVGVPGLAFHVVLIGRMELKRIADVNRE